MVMAEKEKQVEAKEEKRNDTGLLDHLLKHIDGKVAPGGTERFCRCFNTNGIMEYWLESANLDEICQETRVQDPYIVELKLLKTKMA
ncbi:hypothetical protein JHK82_033836 [Glycine max]|nr:hypothetical protein JHK85_034551 [Glycine max]KAG4986228.1 hypothetical protein JHK86_033919 [Glycine max]KAG5119416.1 hypothetical protein JHK82_033836 [Glycine max]KAG5140408.1 hypothetical protein JHK84_034176 [Glycine max]